MMDDESFMIYMASDLFGYMLKANYLQLIIMQFKD